MSGICNCLGEGEIQKNCRDKGFLLLHITCMTQAKQSKRLNPVAAYRKRVGQFDKFCEAQMG